METLYLEVFDSRNTCKRVELGRGAISNKVFTNHQARVIARQTSAKKGVYKVIAHFGSDWAEYEKGECVSSTSLAYIG